ncbi:MAG: XylR family transcriptional regulator [Planctomyces sp.]|nr:XylR family transcriptional regulator [Planctomyces sp.]
MRRRVALIIETSSEYGRGLLSGIVRYMRIHDDWSVFLEQRGLFEKPPSWIKKWQGDGIITRVTNDAVIDAAQTNNVPLVELTDRHGEHRFPQIRSDDHRIGELGAEHFLERGFERFAFCGFSGEQWSLRRQEAFVETVRSRFPEGCSLYNTPWGDSDSVSWDEEQQRIESWLQTMGPPFAVMSCNDLRGKHVIDACAALGLSVPEQVAVLGVDNGEQLCNLCSPPLSSVIPDAEEVGFRAAELLAQLMTGADLCPEIMIPPIGIATRQSTDAMAVSDPDMAKALNFIRENACRNIRVQDVVDNVSISRSTLERQCRQHLGRSPQGQIRYEQVKRVRELILRTELSLEEIAYRCGFEHAEYMHVVFKRITGTTPGALRQRRIG